MPGVGHLPVGSSFFRSAGLSMPTHMEINGNTEAEVDGCSGILEYDTEVARIRTGRMTVRFEGRNLTIKCLTADSLVVAGFLTGIFFMN